MTDDGRIHYRDSKPPRVRRALPITADAKRWRDPRPVDVPETGTTGPAAATPDRGSGPASGG
jgi:hypothetical protein